MGLQHPQRVKDRVLECFANCGRVDLACKWARVDRATHYRWLESDQDYRAKFEELRGLRGRVTQMLEDEAMRRAREGWDEPIYHRGKKCGEVRKYSDTLLIFLLKAANPEKYRERFDVRAKADVSLVSVVREILDAAEEPEADGTPGVNEG